MLAPLSLLGSKLSLLFLVEDVDLRFLRNREDIKRDKKAFLNDNEWELLSVTPVYNILQNSAGDFAQIQFNVGSSPPSPIVHFSAALVPLCWVEESLLHCISSFIIIQEKLVHTALDIYRDQRCNGRSWDPIVVSPQGKAKRMAFRHQSLTGKLPSAGILQPSAHGNIISAHSTKQSKQTNKQTDSPSLTGGKSV